MMKVEVRLFAQLRKHMPRGSEGVAYVDLPENSTGSDLIDKLEIPRNRPLIFMLNGRRKLESETLQEGDRVGIFPPVGGG